MIISNKVEKKVNIDISKCPKCGNEIKGTKCDYCGYELCVDIASTQQFNKSPNKEQNNNKEFYALCPVCSMQVFSDEKKCSNCGTTLDWKIEENKTYKINCFFCGEEVDIDTETCPKCGANLVKLDTSESRNPHKKKYIMGDGSVMEGNGWLKWGAVALVSGLFMTLYFVIFGADAPSIITSIIIMSIGILCSVYGSYRVHKGKTIVRKENDKIRQTNPEFKSQEDEEDIWDKLKNFIHKDTKTNNISSTFEPDIKNNQSSMHDELRNLKSLLDDNIINQTEFDEAKKAILQKYQKDQNQ